MALISPTGLPLCGERDDGGATPRAILRIQPFPLQPTDYPDDRSIDGGNRDNPGVQTGLYEGLRNEVY